MYNFSFDRETNKKKKAEKRQSKLKSGEKTSSAANKRGQGSRC
jgi:hypothetical protein